MHALVLMAPSGAAPATPELQADHERFIDGLNENNRVVTGGGLKPATDQFEARPWFDAHRTTRPAKSGTTALDEPRARRPSRR